MKAGLVMGLFTPKHFQKMGSAVWLFGWLVGSQTRRNGLVHGGKPYTYRELADRIGFPPRTLENWVRRLQAEGYIVVKHVAYKRMQFVVLNQKKYTSKQADLPLTDPVKQRDKVKIPSRQIAGSVPADQRDIARQIAGSNKTLSMTVFETPDLTLRAALGISIDLWATFKKMRAGIRRPIIPGCEDSILEQLAELQAAGENPVELLKDAIRTSSFTFHLKGGKNVRAVEAIHEKRSRANARAILDVLGSPGDVARPIRGALPPAD